MIKVGQKIDRLTVLEDSGKRLKNGKTIIWKCQCDCGEICYKSTTSLNDKKVKTKSCGCASSLKKNIIGQKFGLLTVIDYTNQSRHGSAVWKCQCECGNITYATTEGLRTGDNTTCGCRNRGSEAFAQRYKVDFTGKIFGKLTVIGATDMRTPKGNQIWKCQCECGNICYVSTNHLQTGNTKSCGCLQGISVGELKIKKILEENNINFKSEYIFQDLPTRRYDFAIFDENQKIIQLIEFDGEQHYFETSFFKKTLKEQQEIDKEKNDFAEKKGIKLIRIPYWKRDNLTLEDLQITGV